MHVGVFYFPTDYGIDIRELARAASRSVASSRCCCRSTLTFRHLAAPHIPAEGTCPRRIRTPTIHSLRFPLPPL